MSINYQFLFLKLKTDIFLDFTVVTYDYPSNIKYDNQDQQGKAGLF
jgi:hypothetical protein